ncbi:translation initiation factor eIF 4e-like domain-containing protein [Neohortaea acidophila]|uniref:Translation initiation factor eIF 4e-like domain-containing protein n=1 Tax=Neohortaea acidophila TaxID=245834 RepID=A0A6A6Q2V6_9PEZI|nr:translation initiation factor eIF 4e-like domain-containing protein [Neohortaea acidophila]KAF2486324.1 translation initiation factor eIF 4e-like domain-containing protein [Neohortaea acidophila]
MTDSPRPQNSALNDQTMSEAAPTAPPARGQEMRKFLQSRLLQKNRAPPLVHSWDFWHARDKKDAASSITAPNSGNPDSYEDRLEVLATVDDVRKFWNVFNNFDIGRLALRDSIHLFHKGIKPTWEDSRNTRGGSWTFRVPKAQAVQFWLEVCMMAIGEQLQAAVESERTTFKDDICGVSLGVRFNSVLIQIWNRDGEHAQGIDKLLVAVKNGLSEDLTLKEGSFYYKRHNEHAGFTVSPDAVNQRSSTTSSADGMQPLQSIDAIANEAPAR